ncbi:MFS transporter [Paracoccus suum]|uniref:MFS transporter n=2 Tax=Paracoccus suum TaxID=2259340 RepID=A0A344PLS1_9RHOB|nr:multidrug effflux MFS transporter [Paracoccus suum]AXC50326.1 MFS transporter [Paracoccus suum]
MPSPSILSRPRRALSMPEFVAVLAFTFAVVAFSIDAMLPALPQIAAEMVPGDVNRAQLVLTAFMIGLGGGTLFTGPISDAIGRKPTIIGGFVIYLIGAVAAMLANSIEALLIARVIQGIGASGPRIAVLALVRDLLQGREMARVMSLVNMLFILVPAIAPSIGQAIIAIAGWRGVFGAFIVFALLASSWIGLRQPETLPAERRRPLHLRTLAAAVREALSDRDVVICTATIALGFGQMFALLSSAQQLFGEAYARGDQFPLWFAAMALLSACGTILNARLVVRLGMRRIASTAYAAQAIFACIMLILVTTGAIPEPWRFAAFFVWAVSLFTMAGVTFGNLNAIALHRMGHIAGMVASLVAALSTVGAMLIAAPVGQLYNGTPVPVIAAAAVCSAVAWLLMRRLTPGST